MGKIRAKRRAARSRPEPAGLPTTSPVKAIEETSESPESRSLPILHRLASHDVTERKWACTSLSHLLLDCAQRTELIQGRVVRRLTPLLLDEVMEIREAAAGALRNMSSVDEPGVLEYMASEDIMTHLSALVKDTVARLVTGMEEGKKEKMTADRGVLLSILEEALCLLWNMSEGSSVVVEVFNREELLPFILQLLQPTTHPLSLCLAAAQLLHVVTEDNQDAIRLVVSLPGTLSHLESVLDRTLPDDDCGRGQMLVLRVAIAGVFHNCLAALPEAVIESTLCGVLAVVASVLCVDTAPLLTGCQGDSETEELRLIFSAQELACEVLANVCYNEGDGSDGGEWADCDSVEDVEGADMMEASQMPVSRDLPSLKLIVEAQAHTKVCNLFLHLCSVFDTCPEPVIQRLTSLMSAALLTLQNLASSLPTDVWQDHMRTIWPTLFNLPSAYNDNTFPVLGLLLALVDKLDTSQLLTEEQLMKVCKVGVASGEVGVRADIMRLVGAAASSALRHTTPHLPMLQIAGSTLRDCVAKDPSLWVVSQALDSIFDMFGSDSCPPPLLHSLSLLPVLRQSSATFSARLRVERKGLGPHISMVQSAKVNLPRFISYMASKH